MIRISLREEVLVLVTTGRAIFCFFDVFQQDCLVAMMVLAKNFQSPISSTFGQGLQVELLQKTCGTGLVICPSYTTNHSSSTTLDCFHPVGMGICYGIPRC